MGLDTVHDPRAAGFHLKRVVKRAVDCASGGLYASPTAGQTLNPTNTVNISWNNVCLGSPSPALVDVYLYAPAASTPLIHVWANVPASTGSYADTINPGWWNATAGSTQSLQLLIVEAGQPAWMTSSPSGPIFKIAVPANYTPVATGNSGSSGSSAGTAGSAANGDSIYQSVTQLIEKYLPKGVIAAAVIIPILFLVIAAVVYIKWSRKKEAKKRARFSQALDKRMSVISTDWKPSSAAAARASIAVGAHRGSLATSVYMPRPSSTFASEGGQAGLGAYGGEMSEKAVPRPSFQTQRSLGAPTSQTTRLSRVSFAPTVHPRMSMAAKDVLGHMVEDDEDGAMSPTQMQGPTLLADDDVARGSMDETFRAEVLQMPAMTMMRTGRLSTHLPPPVDMPRAQTNSGFRSPSPPSATNAPKSPLTGFFPPASPAPAHNMTPDEQLRAYAARRAASPLPPAPAAVGSHPGMRVLYDPSAHQQVPQMQNMHALMTPPLEQASASRLSVVTTNPFRQSAVSNGGESVASRYSTADMTHGHEHEQEQEREYEYAYEPQEEMEELPRGSAL